MARKSRQGAKEHTYSIPPMMWWFLFLVGIGIGFYFGTAILQIIFIWISTAFSELAGLMGSALAIIAILIVLYLLIRMRISISALLFGLIIGVVLGAIVLMLGIWSPVPPGESEVPKIIMEGLL